MKHSIRNRLLVTTTCVLAVFLALTGWVLDRSFRNSVLTGVEEQLRLVIYAVMGAVEARDGQLAVANELSEPRLAQPESGLYAQVSDDLNGELWTSPSALASQVSFPDSNAEPGVFSFQAIDGTEPRYVLSYTVIWEDAESERVVFSAATDQRPFRASITQFRRSLGAGFGAATVLFVIAQLLALRWGLRPLRTMASEVQALESGERERLSDGYPRELHGLARNLDRFIEHEQRSRTRYRNALEDLAHSLKTPLAVVRNSLLDLTPDKGLVAEQLERMETTVTHQLSKASVRGPVVVGKPVPLAALLERLQRALQTAYADRGIQVDLQLDSSVKARGDERDFMEIFGNLMENAFKYTTRQVRVGLSRREGMACCVIEDDGPGIPDSFKEAVLNRGQRLDQIQPGQGIGLAVVADLVGLYQGKLEIGQSELGGARLTVLLS